MVRIERYPTLEVYYRSNLSLILARELWVVNLGLGEVGVYASDAVNTFGTPLMVKGQPDEVKQFLVSRNLMEKVRGEKL